MKKIKISSKVGKIIFIVSAIVFVISLAFLVKLCFLEPHENKTTMQEIEEVYYKDADSDEKQERGDLAAVQAINGDIKGWIKLDGTPINYPVLQSPDTDSTYYLYRNYKKNSSGFGSIFLDSLCEPAKPSKNLILYGHNMRDGSMFGHLLKYDNLDFYKEHPVIMFDTTDEQADWKIISVFKTNTLEKHGEIFDYLKIDFANDNDFLQFVYDVRVRSLIDIPVDVGKNDRLITLSTCSYELDDFRTVVVARKVREGESTAVELRNAKMNENPLMPRSYYTRYGGKAPVLGGFIVKQLKKTETMFMKKSSFFTRFLEVICVEFFKLFDYTLKNSYFSLLAVSLIATTNAYKFA